MTASRGKLGMSGKLTTRFVPCPKIGLDWKIRNVLSNRYLKNLLSFYGAKAFSKLTNVITMTGSLNAKLFKADGQVIDYGRVAHGLVTTAFVEYMVDEMIVETTAWGDFQFHDSGIGTTAAAVGNTDIETTDNVARTDGTQLEGATGEIYKSVGSITYVGTLAITEHGLFNIITAGILLDRHVFAAINVDASDSIQFTYELTVNDGG